MIISYEGKDWNFDRDKITVDEWRELKRKLRMTPKGFQDGLDEADPDAMTFLYWVMLRQSGDQRQPLGDQLKPDVIALNNAVAAALKAEAEREAATEAEAEPDPTRGSPSRPASPPSPAIPAPASPRREVSAPITAS